MLTYSRHLYNKVFFPRRKTVAVTSGELKVLSLRLSFHSNFEAFVLHVFYNSIVLKNLFYYSKTNVAKMLT